MNRTQQIMSGILVFLFVLTIGFYLFVPRHRSTTKKFDTYMIEENFDQVKKVLVRTDALETLVSAQHGEVVHQEWDSLSFSSNRILTTKWNVDGKGEFTVKATDPHMGEVLLRFRQEVRVDEDWLKIDVFLAEPVGALREYRTVTHLSRDGERTKVHTVVSLIYERKLPRNYINYMDEIVEQSAQTTLDKSREAMRDLIAKYGDKRFIFRLKE